MILKGILGINITPFLATSAILTAVIGLALQGVLGNILAGLSLHFTRSFSRGDWVKIGETEGIVMETNWRETRILDRASNMIVLPNNAVASGTITNFSQPDPKAAITLPLKIGYRSGARRRSGDAQGRRARGPRSGGLAGSSGLYPRDRRLWGFLPAQVLDPGLSAEILHPDRGRTPRLVQVQAAGHRHPGARRGRAGQGPGERSTGAGRKRRRRKAVERNLVDLLNSSFLRHQEGDRAGQAILTDAEAGELASLARRVVFTPGEVLFRQGEKGEACYIIARGKVKGRVSAEENGKSYGSEFQTGPGGIVGEMSLFTGMPRTATVAVEEEAELLEIGAEAFVEILARNPGLAESVAELVSQRNRNNLESLRKIKELSAGDLEAGSNKKTVLEYLRKLVGLFKK